MKRLRGFFILLFTAIMLVLGWGGWLLLTTVIKDSYFTWYPIIPVFYYIMGVLTALDLTKSTQDSVRKLVLLIRFIFHTVTIFALKVVCKVAL